jgi:hypothetical protein
MLIASGIIIKEAFRLVRGVEINKIEVHSLVFLLISYSVERRYRDQLLAIKKLSL